jgi:TFIIF-interacting CTD phosphatase-like protein
VLLLRQDEVRCVPSTSVRSETDGDCRPGLREFLKGIAEMYEMHVYTMGTRAYAVEVCKIIDPDGGLFGGRILSRDESGSESLSFVDCR